MGGVNISNIVDVFLGRSKKGKSSHDDDYGHGQEKGGPSTYVEGKKVKKVFWPPPASLDHPGSLKMISTRLR